MAELTIRPDEIRDALANFVQAYEPEEASRQEVGTVAECGDGIARVEGLPSAMANELLEFPGGIRGLALNLDDVEDELFRFGRIASGEPELLAALSDQRLPDGQKRALLDELLAAKVAPASLQLIAQAAIHPRGRNLEANLADYARLVAAWRQRLIAVVRVATGLSDQQRQRLTRALSAIYGHGIQLNVVIDPQVVGGVSVQVGDEVIDGTLSSRLAALRRHWAA